MEPFQNTLLIAQSNDEHFMRLALVQAQRAQDLGEVPVGAIIVQQNHVIASGLNCRELRQDPMAHAELMAIHAASEELGTWRLTDVTLYTTLEPCPMCAGAIIQARIPRLVFGTHDPKAGACGSICNLLMEPRFNHQVKVESGLFDDESRKMLQTFFSILRRPQPSPL